MAYAFVGSNPTPSTNKNEFMKKIVCLDLDGVAVAEHEKFSSRLIEQQGVEIKPAVDEYFSKYFGAVMVGKLSLTETIAPYIPKFNWPGDTESLLRFWFDREKTLVQPVLEIAQTLRDEGTPTFIVTDNPRERTDELWDELLCDYFTGKYVSGETGLKKSGPEIWDKIASDNDVKPNRIFFTDDDPENISVASNAGVHAVQFSTSDKLSEDIRQFLLEV